jgi:hypothetical protein
MHGSPPARANLAKRASEATRDGRLFAIAAVRDIGEKNPAF